MPPALPCLALPPAHLATNLPSFFPGGVLQNLARGHAKYRERGDRYASLFFVACIDQDDNELITLEKIHLFVEVLDRYFGNVCELDIIFNFHKAYYILDELFIGGELQVGGGWSARAAASFSMDKWEALFFPPPCMLACVIPLSVSTTSNGALVLRNGLCTTTAVVLSPTSCI